MNPCAAETGRKRGEGSHFSEHNMWKGIVGRRGRKPYSVKVESISDADWNYLYGLYLADGSLGRKYEVKFALQGDEGRIVKRVAKLLRRTGLRPHIAVGESGKDDIIIRAYSTRLVELFPNKKTLMRDTNRREKFFEKHKLFRAENGIPFLAGLLDGDGCCPATLRKRHGIRGEIDKWGWSFRQTRLPFLIDYIVTFVNAITPNGLRVTVDQGSGKRTIRFRKSSTTALLDAGLERYSQKATHWIEKTDKLQKNAAKYHTTGEIARMLNVSDFTVRKWIITGKLKCSQKSGIATERHWKHVSEARLEKFKRHFFRQNEIAESAKRNGVRLKDVAEMIGVSYSKLYKWYRQGRLRAHLIHEVGPVHTYLVMQNCEAEELAKHVSKERERVEDIKNKGMGLGELAAILRAKPNTLYAIYKRGGFEATLVREHSGKGYKRLIVPRKEVNRLRIIYQAVDGFATLESGVPRVET